jgi:hypothetical protein
MLATHRQLPAKRSEMPMDLPMMAHAFAAQSQETRTTRKPITKVGLRGVHLVPGIAATTAHEPIVS